MQPQVKEKILAVALLVITGWMGSAAVAYDSGVYDNLNRSRDALLSQREHLEQTADSLNKRIAQLQQQLDSVNSYLRDTDRAIRDVDSALRRY
jgi:cell division protein FtsB